MPEKFIYLVVNATTRTCYVSKEYSAKSSASRAARTLRSRQSASDWVDTMIIRSYQRESYLRIVSDRVDVTVFPS